MEIVNQYLQENQLFMYEKEKDRCGMGRNIHALPTIPQLRTARHIDGNAVFTGDEWFRHSETSIGTICDFEFRDRLYEVPYGTLVKDGFDNLIACGRCASAVGRGWDVLRVIPPAVLTGQAAGTAAALALSCRVPVVEAPVRQLQQELAQTGVMIHYPDAMVPLNGQA